MASFFISKLAMKTQRLRDAILRQLQLCAWTTTAVKPLHFQSAVCVCVRQ